MSTYCETTLNYAAGEDRVALPVSIRNGREANLDYEKCGFTLLEHESAVSNWRDEDEVSHVHRPEAEQVARDFLGCAHAMAYTPIIRSPETALTHADYAPIEFVHCDFTDDYRPMIESDSRAYSVFIRPFLSEHGLTRDDIRSAGRVVLLQLWRNIGNEQPDYPLAFCDASTTSREDLGRMIVPEYGGERLEFEIYFANAPSQPSSHHWYTYPRMKIDECVAFRTYDSLYAEKGEPHWTLHSAFRDTTLGADAPRRESVEMRILCLFD
jgi:hypothetical protein